jgi:hypothetical protein
LAKPPRVPAGKKKVTDQTPFQAQDDVQEIVEPEYTDEQRRDREFKLRTMVDDFNKRESPHVEYNGMTYTENYRNNMLSANSYTPPRQNADETQVVTGTTREKVLAIVSAVLNLNFETKFKPFDEDDVADEELGEAMSDCVERSNMIEMWDEKKFYAYFEMAVQGDVYVEELWVDEVRTDKERIPLDQVTAQLMADYRSSQKTKTVSSMAQRNLIPGTQVFKANMNILNLSDQPHIFTVEYKSYEGTKSIFGNLPRFANVPRHLLTVAPAQTAVGAYGWAWRLDSSQSEDCEIIKFYDPFNDEFQLCINGVFMLPVGFPMPWSYGEYNITQGRLEPISAFFSESKSIPCKTKLDQEILDEMYRLAVLKTQKSFMPPIANYSNNILSRSMFGAGKVNNALQKGEIEVLGGNPNAYTLQPSEFQMIEMVKKFIDEKSISPNLAPPPAAGQPTATQVNSVMQLAKQQLGLLIFGFMQFHLNLDTIRLYNVLKNYPKTQGDSVSKVDGGITQKYRNISITKNIGSKGVGVKKIQFTENHSTPSELYDMEHGITRDKATGKATKVVPPKVPQRIMQISPKALRSTRYSWYGEVTPSEKDSSISDRIAYEDRITWAVQTFGIQALNIPSVQQQWATKNKLNAGDFFNQNQKTQMLPGMPVPGVPGQPGAPAAPGGGAPQPGAPAPGGPPQPGKPQMSNMHKQLAPFSSGAGPAEAARQGFGK